MARGAITVKIDGQYDDKDINRAIKDLNRLKSEADGSSEFGDKMKKGFAVAGVAAAAAAAAFVAFSAQAVKAAMDEEAELARLNTTLNNLGFGAASEQVNQFVDDLMFATGVADSEMRPALQTLLVGTKDVAKAQELLKVALDLSAAGYGDVGTAAAALSKASNGNLGALQRLVKGGLDPATVKSKDFNGAVEQLSGMVGGQAAAAAQTLSGKMKILSTAFDELNESYGKGIIEGFFAEVTNGSDDLDTATAKLREMQATAEAWGRIVGGWAASALQALDNFGLGAMKVSDIVDDAFSLLIRSFINVADALGMMSDETAEAARQNLDLADAQREAAMRAYALKGATSEVTAVVDPATGAIIGMTDATDDAGEEMKDARTAADSLKASLDKFTTKDEYITAMRDMGKAAKEAKGDLTGIKDASIDLRGEFATAASSLLTYAQAHGTNAADVLRIWDEGTKAIRRRLINNGVKPEDVDAFINTTLWQTRFQLLADTIGKGPAAEAMRLGGLAAVKNAWKGIVQGLNSPEAKAAVYDAAVNLANQANRGAQAALEIASPSKVFERIGKMTVEGLIAGMESEKQKVADKAKEIAQAMIDRAAEIVDKWDDKLSGLKDALKQARQDIADWAKSTSDALTSAFDTKAIFEGSYDETGNFVASKFQSGWDAAMAKFNAYTSVLRKVQAGGGSEALVQFLMAQGITTGTEWGKALIDNGLVKYASDNLATVQTTADTTAQAMVPAFLIAAKQEAKATLEEFKEKYGKDGPYRQALVELMDRLAKAMSTTATITVKTVYEAAGLKGRAGGGPVSANTAYLVGERGPEVLVMGSQSGSIVPNGDLPNTIGASLGGSSRPGGNTYAITVQTGVGDPRQIGQQIVEYIKKFESANGPAFAAA